MRPLRVSTAEILFGGLDHVAVPAEPDSVTRFRTCAAATRVIAAANTNGPDESSIWLCTCHARLHLLSTLCWCSGRRLVSKVRCHVPECPSSRERNCRGVASAGRRHRRRGRIHHILPFQTYSWRWRDCPAQRCRCFSSPAGSLQSCRALNATYSSCDHYTSPYNTCASVLLPMSVSFHPRYKYSSLQKSTSLHQKQQRRGSCCSRCRVAASMCALLSVSRPVSTLNSPITASTRVVYVFLLPRSTCTAIPAIARAGNFHLSTRSVAALPSPRTLFLITLQWLEFPMKTRRFVAPATLHDSPSDAFFSVSIRPTPSASLHRQKTAPSARPQTA